MTDFHFNPSKKVVTMSFGAQRSQLVKAEEFKQVPKIKQQKGRRDTDTVEDQIMKRLLRMQRQAAEDPVLISQRHCKVHDWFEIFDSGTTAAKVVTLQD